MPSNAGFMKSPGSKSGAVRLALRRYSSTGITNPARNSLIPSCPGRVVKTSICPAPDAASTPEPLVVLLLGEDVELDLDPGERLELGQPAADQRAPGSLLVDHAESDVFPLEAPPVEVGGLRRPDEARAQARDGQDDDLADRLTSGHHDQASSHDCAGPSPHGSTPRDDPLPSNQRRQ